MPNPTSPEPRENTESLEALFLPGDVHQVLLENGFERAATLAAQTLDAPSTTALRRAGLQAVIAIRDKLAEDTYSLETVWGRLESTLGPKFSDFARFQADVLADAALLDWVRGQEARAETLLAEAAALLDRSRSLAPALGEQIPAIFVKLASNLEDINLPAARRYAEVGVAWAQEYCGPASEGLCEALLQRCDIYSLLQNPDAASADLARAEGILSQLHAGALLHLPLEYRKVRVLSMRGEYEEAANRALSIIEQIPSDDRTTLPEVGYLYHELALIEVAAEEPESALENIELAFEIECSSAPDAPYLVGLLLLGAEAARKLADEPGEERYLIRAVETAESLLPAEAPFCISTRKALFDFYSRVRRRSAALSQATIVLSRSLERFGPGSEPVIAARQSKASAHWELGNEEQALGQLTMALSEAKNSRQAPRPAVMFELIFDLAQGHSSARNEEVALELSESLLSLLEGPLSSDTPRWNRAHLLRADIFMSQSDYDGCRNELDLVRAPMDDAQAADYHQTRSALLAEAGDLPGALRHSDLTRGALARLEQNESEAYAQACANHSLLLISLFEETGDQAHFHQATKTRKHADSLFDSLGFGTEGQEAELEHFISAAEAASEKFPLPEATSSQLSEAVNYCRHRIELIRALEQIEEQGDPDEL